MRFLCVGGSCDGQWMTLGEMKGLRKEYEPMPIRVPHWPVAYTFKVYKHKPLSAPDVVLLLLDGYRQPIHTPEES